MQVTQSYNRPSTAKADKQGMHFDFAAETSRAPVSIHAMILSSLSYARLMLALREVVKGDWRTPQRDYSKYQEWVKQEYLKELPQYYGHIEAEKLQLMEVRQKLNSELKEVEAKVKPLRTAINKARYDYYKWLYKHDRDKWMVLDPVISVHPDCVIFEAFSIDESSYGRVSVPIEQLDIFGEIAYGTTNIDFSQALADELYRVRSYRAAWLKVAYDQVELSTTAGSSIEKKIDLPDTWVRGFLQVQSASTLPGIDLTLSATTLNEILAILQQRKEKVSPRSLRFRLKKGEKPTIVIDPWGIEIKEYKHIYTGDTEGEIRIWGRRRLSVLQSVLPHAETVEVKLLGTGMPSYWSVALDGHRFDLGLSGWTTNDWAQKGNFDLLASAGGNKQVNVSKVEQKLIEKLAGTPSDFALWMGIDRSAATYALQELCKNGQAMYDHLTGIYRWRKLLEQDIVLETPEEDNRLKYAVQLIKNQRVILALPEYEDDLTIFKADVTGKDDKLFQPTIHLDADGRMKRAECTCSYFRRNKLRQGPCGHIMAATILASKQTALN